MYDLLGYIGGGVLAVTMWPQIWKTYVTKSAKDISWWYLSLLFIGLTQMCLYGVLNKQTPLYVSVSVDMLNVCILSVLKYRFDSIGTFRLPW